MKKKFSLLIISLLLCFNYINAASVNDRVTITTGQHTIIGQHWVSASGEEYTNVNNDIVMQSETYTGLSAAQDACRRATGSSDPDACVYTMQTIKSKCTLDNVSNMIPDQCRAHKATGTCRYDSQDRSYKCDMNGEHYESYSQCVNYCESSCNNYCATDQVNTIYKIGVKGGPSNYTGSFTDQLKDSIVYEYKLNTGDRAYCIQPGRKGPTGDLYCLNKEMNLKDCDDKLQNHYYCGLAQILYYTMIPTTDSNGKTTFTSNDAEYGFGAITAALRMWVSYYGSVKGNPISGIDGVGFEHEFDYFTNTKVYLSTAKAAAGGYTGEACWQAKSDSNLGVLCGNLSGNNNYLAAIPLFNKALAMFNGNSSEKFLDGMLGTSDDKFQIDASKRDNGGAGMVAKWPTSFVEQYERETNTTSYEIQCSLDQLLRKDSRCRMYVQVFYTGADGIKRTVPSDSLSLVGGACSKEKCELEVGGSMTCSQTETTESSMKKYTFEVTLKGYNSVGLIREYRHCTKPGVYQIMYTAAFEKAKSEESGPESSTEKKFEKSVYSDCPCNDDTKCTDFNPVSKTLSGDLGQATCGNNYDSYDTFDKSDPYMNCILHPCKESDKLQFRKTEEVGANKNVCDVYCRREVVFYLANKKKVYAGMQFRYDIGPAVRSCEQTVTEIVRTDVALTSIVLQKQQCTSEIYYDTKNKYGNKKSWQEQYTDAVKRLIEAWNNWKEIETLYEWEHDVNGGSGWAQTVCAKQSYYQTGGCGGRCKPPVTDCPSYEIYMWPRMSYSCNSIGSDSIGSQNLKYQTWRLKNKCTASDDGIVCPNGILRSGNTTSRVEGTPNVGPGVTTCPSSQCCPHTGCAPKEGGGCEPYTYYDKTEYSDATCSSGNPPSKTSLLEEEKEAFKAYKSVLTEISQLVYDLQNCNFFVSSDNSNEDFEKMKEIEDYKSFDAKFHQGDNNAVSGVNKAFGKSSKEYLLSKALCSDANSDCADLTVEYEDELYGKNVTIEKESKPVKSDLNKNYYCKNDNDNNPNCYKYVKGDDNEPDTKNGSSYADHDYLVCEHTANRASCTEKQISLPTNDYSTFITVTETVFWRSDKFSAGAYTGEVGEAGRDGLTTPLGNEEYPVSNGLNTGGKTGNYYVKQHIDNVKIVVDDNVSLDYTCSYDVYNTTNLYDCAVRTKDGQLDITACKNSCYKLVAGVPVIKESCSKFELKDSESKGYGFVYRNIDLNNLFPNERPIGINWSSDLGQNVTNEIEQKGTDLYIDENNIKYSFVLSPTAINRIREYNTQQEIMGVGYQDNSYLSCQLVNDASGLNGFYKCKSAFLEEISQPNNSYDVETIKFSNP